MKEPDSLDSLLREWKAPEPTAELDQSVMSTYRSEVRQSGRFPRFWQRFWTMRISLPAPALLAAVLVIFGLFLWLRPSAAPAALPGRSDAITQLDVSGFQPLPNGEAKIIPAMENHP